MAVCSACFETGVDGNNILTTDAGNLTAWNVRASGANTFKYDTTHIYLGTLSAKIASGASGETLQWTTAYGTVTDEYGRFYMYLNANPASTAFGPLRWYNGGTFGGQVILSSTSKLIVNNAGVQNTGSISVTTGAWVRIEYHVVFGSPTQLTVRLYNTTESTSITETVSALTGSTQTQATKWQFGNEAGGGAYTAWFDHVIANATGGWVGPRIANTVAPAVSGATPVGSTLTCDGGTWNVTPSSTTYQWTRNGGDIGGATSSTYVTQAADVGTAVGCTVSVVGVISLETASQASSNTITVSAAFIPQAIVIA